MSVLSNIIRSLNLEDANNIIHQAYSSRFKGDWNNKSEFRFVNNKIVLFAPSYTKYMLFGRPKGKMPPQEPIEDWMSRYGIKGSSWAIRYKIAKEGTSNYGNYKNDFISPVLPKIVQSVKLELVPEITKVILNELRNAKIRR